VLFLDGSVLGPATRAAEQFGVIEVVAERVVVEPEGKVFRMELDYDREIEAFGCGLALERPSWVYLCQGELGALYFR